MVLTRRQALAIASVLLAQLTMMTSTRAETPSRARPASDGFALQHTELQRNGFIPLFDGKSFSKWDVKPWHEGHWTVRDGVIDYDGKAQQKRGQDASLWTKRAFGDCEVYVEWRLPAKPAMKPHPIVLYNGNFLMEEDNPRKRVTRLRLDAGDSGLYFRGVMKCQANIWSQQLGSGEINGYRTDQTMPPEVRRACIPIKRADRPFGQWNTFRITVKDDRMTVRLNRKTVIDAARLPGLPKRGPIGLQHHGDPVQFRNLWIKELK
ncbi:MAG: DUF1080 domain-containing protein [Pirellulaceae bacterium]